VELDGRNASTLSQASTSYHSWGFTYNFIDFLIFILFNSSSTYLNFCFCFGWKFTYCLQEIENRIENGKDDVDEDIWEDLKIVPECQLKTCLFKNYRGKKCELQFADYVMRNSKVLSNMTIHCACSTDLNAKCQMLQKLSLCLRGCNCKLIFEWWGEARIYIIIYRESMVFVRR